MTGKFRIMYGFNADFDTDKPYQAICDLSNDQAIESWATSFAEARQNLIQILQAMPAAEEIDI